MGKIHGVPNKMTVNKEELSLGRTEHVILLQLARFKAGEIPFQVLGKLYI